MLPDQELELPLIEKEGKALRIAKDEAARIRRKNRKNMLTGIIERRYAKNRKARKNK